MMAAIARQTEKIAPYERWNETRVRRDARDPSYTVAHAAVEAARDLAARRARDPDAERPQRAARQRAPPDRPDLRALARAARPCAAAR